MKRLLSLAVAFYILQSIEGLGIFGRLIYGEWAGQPGNVITQLSNLALMATCVWLYLMMVRRSRRLGLGAVLAIGVALFLCASAAWSIDPPTTLRRGIIYLFVVIGAVGIAGNLDVDDFMELLLRVCATAAIASLVLLAVSPGNAIVVSAEDGAGALRGVFSQKNVCGQAMAAGVLATLHSLRSGRPRRRRDLAAFALFVLVTVLSKSATSLLVIVASSGVDVLRLLYRKRGVARLLGQVLTGLLVPAVLFVVLLPDLFLQLLGKDPTLTGRSELWAYVWADIDLKPLLGWGYAAFWTVDNDAANQISDALKWSVPQAHNGVLEILLNVGVVGLLLFAALLLCAVLVALWSLRLGAGTLAMSCLLCCGAIGILGVSESVMMEPFQVNTSLVFITGLMCERFVAVARRHAEAVAGAAREARVAALIRLPGLRRRHGG